MKQLFRIFTVREVRLAVPAAALSITGDAMAMVALTLRVHDSGRGAYAVALLLVCFSLPVVVSMGIAGEAADRLPPRVVFGLGHGAQVVALLALASCGGLVATCLWVLLLQTGFAFSNPLWSSVLSRAVGDDHVGRLVSIQQALAAVASPVGAGLGGALVQLHGDRLVFLLDAITTGVLLIAGLLVRTSTPPATPGPGRGRRRLALVPRAGLSVVRADRVVWVLVLALLPFVVTLESMNAVEVFLARDSVGATQAQFGLWQSMTGVGAFVGAAAAGFLQRDAGRLRAIVLSLAAMSVAQVGSGLAPAVGWLYGWGVVLGLANAVSNAAIFAVLARRIAGPDRGKALAVVNGLARSCTVLALALGGLAASVLGPRVSFVTAGTAGVLVAVWAAMCLHRIGALDRGASPVEQALDRVMQ